MQRPLGQGRFSEVYLAQHNKTKDFIALKILSPGIEAPKDNIEQFLGEVTKAKALNHPHIVQVLDCGYANGCFFFLLEYFNNKTLANLIKQKGGHLSIDEAKAIIFPVLDALEYGHNMGLVHGSIQPKKILLTNVKQKLRVKLGDYGISAALGRGGFSNFAPPSNQDPSRLAFIPIQQALDPDYAQAK